MIAGITSVVMLCSLNIFTGGHTTLNANAESYGNETTNVDYNFNEKDNEEQNLDDLENISLADSIDPNYQSKYEFADYVVEIPKEIDVELSRKVQS